LDEVFVDSSVFVTHCMAGDSTLIKLLKSFKLLISPNVIEESFYKSMYLRTETIHGRTGKYLLRDTYKRDKNAYRGVYQYFHEFIPKLIEAGELRVLPINAEIVLDSVKISWEYSLLPNDALIAATCKHYGIKKIATFDEDFKRVDFLEVVEV